MNFLGFSALMPAFGLLVDQIGVVAVIQLLSLLGLITLVFVSRLKEVRQPKAKDDGMN